MKGTEGRRRSHARRRAPLGVVLRRRQDRALRSRPVLVRVPPVLAIAALVALAAAAVARGAPETLGRLLRHPACPSARRDERGRLRPPVQGADDHDGRERGAPRQLVHDLRGAGVVVLPARTIRASSKTLAVILGVVGVVLVTTGGHPSLDLGGHFRGDLFVLFAAFVWAAFILLDKKIVANHDVDMRALTAAMVIVTAVSALPAALVFGHGAFPRLSAGFWTVPYTSVFCTVAPFFLWSWGLRRISATTSSVLMLSEVIFALILAGIILGERLSAAAIVGSGLIIGAAVLASRETGSELASGPDVVPE